MSPIPYQAASRPQLLLPLFCSRVPAGFPSPADDYLEAKLDLVELLVSDPAATFMVWVRGDSMSGEHHNAAIA